MCLNSNRSHLTRGGGGGGVTDVFSYIRSLAPFLVQILEFQYFWGVFRKMNMFWGMKILYLFWGHENLTGFRDHFYAL